MNNIKLAVVSIPILMIVVWFLLPEPAALAIIDITFDNPLRDEAQSAEGLILVILNALITIAIPIVTLMIIYAGFLYVTARGNAEQTKKATTALTYAIIGAILIIGAVAITGIMQETICEFRPDGTAGCD